MDVKYIYFYLLRHHCFSAVINASSPIPHLHPLWTGTNSNITCGCGTVERLNYACLNTTCSHAKKIDKNYINAFKQLLPVLSV